MKRHLTSLGACLGLALTLGTVGLTGCSNEFPDPTPDTLTVGLTYQPDIQFAPFYVAEANGYFTAAGVDVKLRHHGTSESLFGAFNAGEEQLVVAGGDEMYQARTQDIGIVAVATLYQQYPVALIFPATAGEQGQAPTLRPQTTVGIPGPYGENYFYLKAVLQHLGLSEEDIDIVNIGYTQAAALQTGQVDAVVGFVNNDVVRLERAGFKVSLFQSQDDADGTDAADSTDSADDQHAGATAWLPLVGASVGVNDALAADTDRMDRFTDALRLGVQFCVEHPEQAVEIAANYVPGLNEQSNKDAALATLQATIPLYGSTLAEYLTLNEATWRSMATFMVEAGFVPKAVPPTDVYTTRFAGAHPK
jgi:NitT/TauT family transport system substrate-binding protein